MIAWSRVLASLALCSSLFACADSKSTNDAGHPVQSHDAAVDASLLDAQLDPSLDATVDSGSREDGGREPDEEDAEVELDAVVSMQEDAEAHDAETDVPDVEALDARAMFPEGGACVSADAGLDVGALGCFGTLSFTELPVIPLEGDARGAAAGDLNGDLVPDLAIAVGLANAIAVLLNQVTVNSRSRSCIRLAPTHSTSPSPT